MAVGRGHSDLVVEFGGDIFVLGLRIKRSNINMERTYKQLFHYLNQLNQPHGYLTLLESKPTNAVTWVEHINWSEFPFELNGVKKQFAMVEM